MSVTTCSNAAGRFDEDKYTGSFSATAAIIHGINISTSIYSISEIFNRSIEPTEPGYQEGSVNEDLFENNSRHMHSCGGFVIGDLLT